MIPFRIALRPGAPLFEQIVYSVKRAIISGQLRPNEPFPSVRTLGKELKINPNTAHKVVTQLVSEGLLEARVGAGTIVAAPGPSSAAERSRLLQGELEQLVVEAKKLGLALKDVQDALSQHWQRLTIPNDRPKRDPSA